MKLEWLDDISNGGKTLGVEIDQLVRLYDFDTFQANKLRQSIQQIIIEKRTSLDLSELDFIENINCRIILHLAETDTGITRADKSNFTCSLTIGGYETIANLLQPFCIKEDIGYQWLYNIDTPIDFLFSPGGGW